MEGLVEEEDDEATEAANEEEHVAVGAITVSEKKTERQRKKQKAKKLKVHTFALAISTIHCTLFYVENELWFFQGTRVFPQPTSFACCLCLLTCIVNKTKLISPRHASDLFECHIFTFLLISGAAAVGWAAEDWPAAAALSASFHKVLHQKSGGENQGQTEGAQGQARSSEMSAQAPWQTKVRMSPHTPAVTGDLVVPTFWIYCRSAATMFNYVKTPLELRLGTLFQCS